MYATSNIPTIAAPGHVNDVVSVLLFKKVTIPHMTSQVTRSQVKENGEGVSLTARWFILNI